MISLYCEWYGRNEDMTPNYDEKHHGTIRGETPGECMALLRTIQEQHDLTKYTQIEIIEVF